MTFKLRDYQQEAVDAVIAHTRKRLSHCLLELATGAGKSLIVAELARFFAKAAPAKRVLCIAPSKELVLQNHAKYLAYGYPASIFCASAGAKCLRNQVIFASPGTAIKQIEKIAHLGVSAIIIDEAHNDTNTMHDIIDAVKRYKIKGAEVNDKVRIIGMTATPYRMGTGYIYAIDATNDEPIYYDESQAIEPYYSRLVYRVTAGELVGRSYLSKVRIGETASESYDTSTLETDSFGRFSSKSTAATFEGKNKTQRIIQKVVATTEATNRMGVMIFGATIHHAEEILSYLPQGQADIVTGKTKKSEREAIIKRFKDRQTKYLVNVDVLTTGFDAPHVDLVAILRATESPGLLQQIVGRGLRLHDDKEYCILLDYAENIERHKLESDIFKPQIKTRIKKDDSPEIDVQCPLCNCVTSKKRRSDDCYAGLKHDRFGNFIVAGTEQQVGDDEWDGLTLMMEILDPTQKDEFGVIGKKEVPVPAHYSRRCSNPEVRVIQGKPVPCSHRFSLKICPHCFAENDIAARHCVECKERLVDPNKKLTEQAGFATVMEEGETRDVVCLGAEYAVHTSPSGNQTLKATYKTELGAVTAWHSKKEYWVFNRLARANGAIPELVQKYSDCEKWDKHPNKVKIRKVMNASGYVQYEVKGVEF